MSGIKVKQHLKAWRARWERKFGEPVVGAWALEFQERGAPHIHTYVKLPQGVMGDLMWDHDAQRHAWLWGLQTWYEIVGSGDPNHLRMGVDVTPCYYGSADENMVRVGKYFWAESGKKLQKTVPDAFEDVGRFWGYWGVKPVEHEIDLSRDEYVVARRAVFGLRKGLTKRNFRKPHGMDGMWVPSRDGIANGVRLQRWAKDIAGGDAASA
jgi:hypothetical protein